MELIEGRDQREQQESIADNPGNKGEEVQQGVRQLLLQAKLVSLGGTTGRYKQKHNILEKLSLGQRDVRIAMQPHGAKDI